MMRPTFFLKKSLFYFSPRGLGATIRRVAPPTALLAGRPPVQRLTSIEPQRDIARSDDERSVRARPCFTCNSPFPWRAPVARFRGGCSNCEPSRCPAGAAGRRGGCRTGTPIAGAFARRGDCWTEAPCSPVLCVWSNALIKRRLSTLSCANIRKLEPGEPTS
jgi:hypothetical protein